MKKLSFSIILTLLIFITLPCIVSYAATYGTPGPKATELIKNFNDKYGEELGYFPESISDGSNTYYVDNEIAEERKMIVYGNPQAVLDNPPKGVSGQNKESNQWRYLGFIETDEGLFPITNPDFPPDFSDYGWYWPTNDPDTCHWQIKPWEHSKEPWNNGQTTPPDRRLKFQIYHEEDTVDGVNAWILQAIHEQNIEKIGYDGQWDDPSNKFNPKNTTIYENPNNYFTVVSPLTEYTGFQCIGWQNVNGNWQYKTFTLSPKTLEEKKPDLKLESPSVVTYEPGTGEEPDTGTYTATFSGKIVTDPGNILGKPHSDIKVMFRPLMKDGDGWKAFPHGWSGPSYPPQTFTYDGQDFTFKWYGTPEDASKSLKLEAMINYPGESTLGEAGQYEPNPTTDDTGRAVPEFDYDHPDINPYLNNIAIAEYDPDPEKKQYNKKDEGGGGGNKPDISLEITSPDCSDAEKNAAVPHKEYHATITVKVDDKAKIPAGKSATVWYRILEDEHPAMEWAQPKKDGTIKSIDNTTDTIVFTPIPWQVNYNGNITIQAMVNPVLNSEGNPEFKDEYQTPNNTDNDKRAIGEGSVAGIYVNNYKDFTAKNSTPTPAGKYVYLGVYPATESLVPFTNQVAVEAYWLPKGNTWFEDKSWDPGHAKGDTNVAVHEPKVAVYLGNTLNSDNITSGSIELSAINRVIKKYNDIVFAIKSEMQKLSCETTATSQKWFGLSVDRHYDGFIGGGHKNIGHHNAPASPKPPVPAFDPYK